MATFPHYKQLDAMDCGPTCLRMVSRYYGKSYSLQYLRSRSYITMEGVSMLGISEAAENIGFRTKGYRLNWEELRDEYEGNLQGVVPSFGIGKVETGQTVHIKLSGYPYKEHGILIGKINAISLVPDEKGNIVEITLNEGMVSNYREQLKLVQEMEGTIWLLIMIFWSGRCNIFQW